MSPRRVIIDDDTYDLLDQEATARGIPLNVVATEHLREAVEHYAPARSAGERRPVRYEGAPGPCKRPNCSFPTCAPPQAAGDTGDPGSVATRSLVTAREALRAARERQQVGL